MRAQSEQRGDVDCSSDGGVAVTALTAPPDDADVGKRSRSREAVGTHGHRRSVLLYTDNIAASRS